MVAGDTGRQATTKSRNKTKPESSKSKQDQGRSAPKSGPKCEPKAETKPESSKSKQDQGRSAPKSGLKCEPKAETKPGSSKSKQDQERSEPKPGSKLEPKAEAKSGFPGQPFDENIKIQPTMDNAPDVPLEDTTAFSTASPMDDTLIQYETMKFGATSKAPSAFDKANRGYRSAGFRKKSKNISAGPAFVGFHLGKCDTSPSKIEGPSWLKRATERVAKIFKSQNRNIEPAHASPVCKLTENIVKEVCAVQQGETSALQKSVITNVPMSHSFPGVSFTTHGQETADKWSEQFPNVFPQQESEENMDKNAELHCRPPSGLGGQTPAKKPIDEVEPDPWPKKHAADVAEADQVDEEKSPNKMFEANLSTSSPIAELSKSFGGLSLSVA